MIKKESVLKKSGGQRGTTEEGWLLCKKPSEEEFASLSVAIVKPKSEVQSPKSQSQDQKDLGWH